VPEKAKCVGNKQEKVKSYVDTKRRAKLSKKEAGHWVRVESHSRGHIPKRVLSDPLQLVKPIDPATLRPYRMIPLEMAVGWFAR